MDASKAPDREMSVERITQIPPGLYIVSYYGDGPGVDGLRSELPATDLERARVEAKQRADQYGVDVTITGIGPETGFKEIVRPMA